MSRMQVLSDREIRVFDSPPEFTSFQRKQYLRMNRWLEQEAKMMKASAHKIVLILITGYFRAVYRFFPPGQFNEKDIQFITKMVNGKDTNISLDKFPRNTFLRYKKIVLNHFGYVSFSDFPEEQLLVEVDTLLARQHRPRQVFLSLLELLHRRKIEIPSYFNLSEIIRKAILKNEESLLKILETHLNDKQKRLLESLLITEEESKKPVPGKKYYIFSLLKKTNQSIRPAKIKKNINDLKNFRIFTLSFRIFCQSCSYHQMQ